jgi:hypothetical protein
LAKESSRSPHRLPPPIPPPMHILSWVKDYSDKRHFDVTKFVNMSNDCGVNSENLHQLQIENHLTQMSEHYKPAHINLEQFQDAFEYRMERRRTGHLQYENKVIEELNQQIDSLYMKPETE